MAIVYSMTVKNDRLQVVVDALGDAATMVIGTSGLSGAAGVLATLPMADPPFTISNGVMTLVGTPLGALASGAGVATKAELRTSGGVVVASGLTVGAAGSGADFIINPTSVSAGQTVQCSAGTITHG